MQLGDIVRLAEVKKHYNPTNSFHVNENVKPPRRERGDSHE